MQGRINIPVNLSTLYQTVSLRRHEFDEAISWNSAVENGLTSSIFTVSLENAGSGCGRHRTNQLGGDRRSLGGRESGNDAGTRISRSELDDHYL